MLIDGLLSGCACSCLPSVVQHSSEGYPLVCREVEVEEPLEAEKFK